MREQQYGGQEHHELLESIHLRAEVAVEHLVAAHGGGRHLVAGTGAADRITKEKELEQGEYDHQMNVRHETSGFPSEDGTMPPWLTGSVGMRTASTYSPTPRRC